MPGVAPWCTLLVAAAVRAPTREIALVEVGFGELLASDAAAAARLRDALATTGAAAIAGVPGLDGALDSALPSVHACASAAEAGGAERAATWPPLRRTVAGRTIAGRQQELEPKQCAPPLAPLRSIVHHTSELVLAAIDASGELGMRSTNGTRYAGLSALARAGEILEHFHAYPLRSGDADGAPSADGAERSPPAAATADGGGGGGDGDEPHAWTLPMHTDSGVLAIMTPGVYVRACDGARVPPPAETGLYLELPRSYLEPPRSGVAHEEPAPHEEPGPARARAVARVAQSVRARPSSLIVLVGEGGAQWLSPAQPAAGGAPARPLRAAPHAMRVGARATDGAGGACALVVRAWHGRMVLPPADAQLPSGLPFGAQRAAERAELARASGSASARGIVRAPGRRLAAAAAESACTTAHGDEGIMCWTMCMSVSSLGRCAGGAAPVCFDTVTNETVDGGAHCPSQPMSTSCEPRCPPPPEPEPGGGGGGGGHDPTPGGDGPTPPATKRFCSGPGVSMYMEGFMSALLQGERAPCVVLLLPGLVLDSGPRLALGCAACIALGASVELLARGRSRAFRRATLERRRRARLTLFALHAAQLLIGYLLMLAAMTYNLEIFVSVLAGLAGGYAHTLGTERAGHPEASLEPCCPPRADVGADNASSTGGGSDSGGAAGRAQGGLLQPPPSLAPLLAGGGDGGGGGGGGGFTPFGAQAGPGMHIPIGGQQQQQNMPAMAVIGIEGMHCEACVARVHAALERLVESAGGLPADDVSVNLAAGRAYVRVRPPASPPSRRLRSAELVHAVQAEGYSAWVAHEPMPTSAPQPSASAALGHAQHGADGAAHHRPHVE